MVSGIQVPQLSLQGMIFIPTHQHPYYTHMSMALKCFLNSKLWLALSKTANVSKNTGVPLFSAVVLSFSWFVAPFNWRIINIVTLGFCNTTAELFSKSLCSWPQENRSAAPTGDRGPRLRNPGWGLRPVTQCVWVKIWTYEYCVWGLQPKYCQWWQRKARCQIILIYRLFRVSVNIPLYTK